MNITKSEAIVMLAMSIGNADGEFSIQEIDDAITKFPALKQAMADAETTDWLSKYRMKELNAETAIKALEHLSTDDKTEAMVICWGIVLSDGNVSDGERKMMEKWTATLGLRIDDVKAKYKLVTL
jgi:tellurite resistance protein